MSAVLRKKSGFSGFMNSLVGSPKKPLISAPENPVHVTHVGYDSTTGQFTVCPPHPPPKVGLLILPVSLPCEAGAPFADVFLSSRRFRSLPKEWQRLINESGITEKDTREHPQILVDVLTFYKETTEKPQEDQQLEKFHDAKAIEFKQLATTSIQSTSPSPA